MNGTSHKERTNYGINMLGQTPYLQAYGQIMIAFPTPQDHTPADITTCLNDATVKLFATFPRLAGQVVNEGHTEESSGTFSIAPYPPHQGPHPLVVKDCTKICPPWDKLRDARGPMYMFPDEGLSTKKCVPHSYADSGEPQPVLVIQANILEGGIIVTFALQHQAGDGSGFGWIMRHIAAFMRGESVSEALVEGANAEHANILPLLHDGEKPASIPTFDHSAPKANGATTNGRTKKISAEPDVPAATWACFRVTAAMLKKLKAEASITNGNDTVKWISTDDALTAFLWKRITAVRLALKPAETITQCARAIDMRSRADGLLPEGYMGHSAIPASTQAQLGALHDMSLAQAARLLRQLILDTDGNYLRSLVTLMSNTPNKRKITLIRSSAERGATMVSSSWAQLGAMQLVFGPLGKPVFARRAEKLPSPGGTYVMPKFDNGDVDLQVCFMNDELEGLKNDAEWSAYTEYIG